MARCDREIARIDNEPDIYKAWELALARSDWECEKEFLQRQMRTVIGLCGAAGSGKDAAANALNAAGFKRLSFAEPLRQEVHRAMSDTVYRARLWSVLPDICRAWIGRCYAEGELDPWKKPTSESMRGLLQTWGAEFRRSQDPDYWTARALESLPESGKFVFTDCRFPNEYKMIRSVGGNVYLVERHGIVGNGHVSESFWPHFKYDAVIENNGTLEDLRSTALRVCCAESSILSSASFSSRRGSKPQATSSARG